MVDQTSTDMTCPAKPVLGQTEFVALMAMLFATIAMSIDAMLPALPSIAAEISRDFPNRAQLIITSFVLGMGIGTLFTGPLSDAYGRRPVMIGGAALYVLGTALAWQSQTLETMFAARVLQGLGAAGPRVVALAIIRDLYAGRKMARLMSFIMLVFTLVPAMAPTLGAGIIWLANWRAIFIALILFSVFSVGWLLVRQPETLPVGKRRPFRLSILAAGVREIITNRIVTLSLIAQSCIFGILFAVISSTQQIFDQTFGRGDTFPLWFGGIALLAGTSSLVNAALVERLGMRFMITTVLGAQILLSGSVAAIVLTGHLPVAVLFPIYLFWTTGVFFQNGLLIGNLNALAMEPMGHLAGLTASITGSISTVAAVFIAIPIGLAFDGTPLPLIVATFVISCTAFATMLVLRWTDRREVGGQQV